MIFADRDELAEPRRLRWTSSLDAAGIDGWLLTSSIAIRLVIGAWSDSVDRDGEVCRPLVAAGRPGNGAVVESTTPVVDASLVDDVLDHLPVAGRLAVDRLGMAGLERLAQVRPRLEVVDAGPLLAAARRHKDPAEVATILDGTARAEAALSAVLGLAKPGVRERELAAAYHAAAIAAGLTDLHVDTVFCALPVRQVEAPWARGPWSGWSPYRQLTDERPLRSGDHLCFDGGFLFDGYMVDVGWTILVGREPSSAERGLAARWADVAQRVADVLRPGATAAEARSAALAGWPAGAPAPWPYPLYVAHGVGLGGVEPPLAGTELGPEAEETMVIEEGQIILVEPYVWEEGIGGYRAELCVLVTANGPEVVNGLEVTGWPATGEVGATDS